MLRGNLSVTNDASPGAWIAPTLHGDFGAVTLTVPSGYAAYARICHPATDVDGTPVSWSEVAEATGRTAHPLMQWHALVGSPDHFNFKGSLWHGTAPDRGNLVPRSLEALCGFLREHTTDAEHCFFGLWMGWCWVERGSIRADARHAGTTFVSMARPTDRVSPAFSAEELSRPRLKLPGRDYLLLAGSLSAATQIGDPEGVGGFDPQSPNLFWPTDRTWFVASEIDFDSTLVGGTADLIHAILDAPELDAWPVNPDDSLAFDADRVNHIPAS